MKDKYYPFKKEKLAGCYLFTSPCGNFEIWTGGKDIYTFWKAPSYLNITLHYGVTWKQVLARIGYTKTSLYALLYVQPPVG